jgi:hypothetical protein
MGGNKNPRVRCALLLNILSEVLSMACLGCDG